MAVFSTAGGAKFATAVVGDVQQLLTENAVDSADAKGTGGGTCISKSWLCFHWYTA